MKYVRQKQWHWNDAVSIGVGFGAIEAIALGAFSAIVASLNSDINAMPHIPLSFIGPMERLICIVVHATSVAMIIYALTRRKWRWFLASFFYKSGVDVIAAFLLLSGTHLMETHPWIVELFLFGPFAYIGLWFLLILRRIWDATDNNAQIDNLKIQ